ncbi:hypothetical protein Bca101_043777 [Brassica carinata]
MNQSLCVPYIAGKAQRLTGQSIGPGGSTLFPYKVLSQRVFLVRFLMRELFKVPSLTQDLLELSLPSIHQPP